MRLYMITCSTMSVRLQYSVVRLCVIERRFHFAPHLSSETVLPCEITEHKIMTYLAISNTLFCG